jgi:hypothetical protein
LVDGEPDHQREWLIRDEVHRGFRRGPLLLSLANNTKGRTMIDGTCHCGALGWTLSFRPDRATACNCTACRRFMMLTAYGDDRTISLRVPDGGAIRYVSGDRTLAFVSCATCGCTTHWESLTLEEDGRRRIAVNLRMAEPAAIDGIRVRRFDGLDSWTFLD